MVRRPHPVRAAGAARCAVVEALNAEWEQLVSARCDEVATWSTRRPALAGCADLADVLAATHEDADGVLGALLAEARSGCELAARAVVQAMLPKLVCMGVRSARAGIDDFVGSLWCRIRTYPLERRPTRIAANLALDTLKDVTAAGRVDELELLTPWPPGDHVEALLRRVDTRASPTADAVLAAAHRGGLIDRPTGLLLHAVYVDGLTSAAAGARFATSAATVRYRCSQAVRRLAAARAELGDAAA